MAREILLIDDDPNVQTYCKMILESAGFSLRVCSTAAEARESLRRSPPPDLAIVDIGLPDGNGLALCEELGLGSNTDFPILFLTARGNIQTRMDAFRIGARDYIQKPFAVEELLARVSVHVKIKESQDELTRRFNELQLRDRAHQDLTDMIIHDLKTPLNSIMGTLELIRRQGLISSKEYNILVEYAGTAADFMLLMINDLLDLAQAEQVGLTPEIATFDIAALMEKLKALFTMPCRKAGVSLSYGISEDVKTWTTDEKLVFRVLANLISNAVRVSKDGQEVRIECLRHGGSARFMVMDRGPGVPDAEKAEIFQKYTRGQSEDILKKEGRGIGLAFCRVAAGVLRGKIWVEDREGGGSRFILEAADLRA